MLRKTPSLKDLVYTNLTDKEIFSHYFGEEISLGKAYSSKLRSDDSPSTGFYVSPSGKIIYNDLTTGEKLDSVNFVMRLFKLEYFDALKKIIKDFQITATGKVLPSINTSNIKEETIINILPRDFTEKDIDYFKSYCITGKEVRKYNIHSVQTVLLKGRIIHTKDDEIKLAYILKDSEKDIEYVKLYSPSSKKFKWISNIPLNKPFGLDSLPRSSNTLIITKSLKDMIVMRKFFPDTIGLQNESLAALTEEDALILKDMYKHIYVFFDNDTPGIKASSLYKEEYDFSEVRIPERALSKCGVKDPSDYIKKFGIKELEKLFRWLNLINL